MSAFEELGTCPEIIAALEDEGWLLPTPIQAECVGLVLGGGDVCAAAETGSGKTGAFAIPTVQAAHELLCGQPKILHTGGASGGGGGANTDKQGAGADSATNIPEAWRDPLVSVRPGQDADAIVASSLRAQNRWCGIRFGAGAKVGTHGVGFTCKLLSDGLARVGFAAAGSPALELGIDKLR